MIGALRTLARSPYVRLSLASAAATWGLTALQQHLQERQEEIGQARSTLDELGAQIALARTELARSAAGVQQLSRTRDLLLRDLARLREETGRDVVDVLVVDVDHAGPAEGTEDGERVDQADDADRFGPEVCGDGVEPPENH